MELASFICAILVVAIHVPAVDVAPSRLAGVVKQIFSNGICRIAVPYFFLASGFFLGRASEKDGWYMAVVRKRFGSLLVPYLIWSIMWTVFLFFMGMLSSVFHSKGAFELPVLPSLIHVFGLDFSALPNMYVLWFIRALIVLVLVSPLIIVCAKKRILGGTMLLTLYAYLFLSEYIQSPIVKGVFPPQGITYFSTGVFFAFCEAKVVPKKPLNIAFVLCGLAVIVGKVIFAVDALWLRHIGVIILLAGFWGLLPSVALPTVLRRMSFPIYLLHLFVLIPLAMSVHAITGNYLFNESLAGFFAYWFFGSVGSLMIGRAFLKTDLLSRICFGGR